MNQVATKDELMQQSHAPANGHTRRPSSESTLVEQSRAIAQVQGALVVARQNPRDEIEATHAMRDVCQNMALAERAFFRYNRGGQQISGPSIRLAEELARCWGNVDFGISELRRDDVGGVSEMLAYAWDLENNLRVASSFIVPHKRDKKGGPVAITDMRDIYENNSNQAARRLRECIFRVLPTHYKEEAKALCAQTLRDGGGVPIEQRRERLLEAFAAVGVTRKQIEHKAGRTANKLTELDIATLRVVYGSITQGEATIAEEFEIDAAAEANEEIQRQQQQVSAPAPESPSPSSSDAVIPPPEAEPEDAVTAQQPLPDMPPEPKGISDKEFETLANNSAKATSEESLEAWLKGERIVAQVNRMNGDQMRSWTNHLTTLRNKLSPPLTEPADAGPEIGYTGAAG